MTDQQQLATTFTDLHQKGVPVILYNIWDPGSAQAVMAAGAKAIATGSHGVANAFGYEDGEKIPLDIVLANAQRVVAMAGELPVTMDLETGYGETAAAVGETAAKVIATGVVGVNLEDQIFGTKDLRPTAEQAKRIAAIRAAADSVGVPLFINARTDLFKNADPATHDGRLLDTALERAEAYAAAGANGFFVPLLKDIELIRQLCERSPLPVNILWLDGMVPVSELAEAGVARVSFGPGPYLKMVSWLESQAKAVYNAA